MNPIEARIRAREVAMRLLNDLTTWIAAGSLVAVGLFSFIAAATIPGKASPSPPTTATVPSPASSGPTNAPVLQRHHRDSSGISASSGPPMVATGASH
jgi:hypothetical protein